MCVRCVQTHTAPFMDQLVWHKGLFFTERAGWLLGLLLFIALAFVIAARRIYRIELHSH